MKALEKQEGGAHYKTLVIQPVEYIHANNLNFFEGNVIKYVTRHRTKAGLQDLLKARHYIELLLQLEYGVDANGVPHGDPRTERSVLQKVPGHAEGEARARGKKQGPSRG